MYKLLFLLTAFCLVTFQSKGQSNSYPFLEDSWKVYNAEGNQSLIDTFYYKGKQSIKLEQNEIALLQKMEFKNFKLDVDITGSGMAGIGFRANNLFNYEFIYFRSKELAINNTIQYVPIYNGSTGWQLYPGEEYQKKVSFSMKDWFHVTIEVTDSKLKLIIKRKCK